MTSFEEKENTNIAQFNTRWLIDLGWLQQNSRSFPVLARSCLCSKHHDQLKGTEGEISGAELLSTVKDCCSKTPGFITSRLPIMESIFRIFLINGNQPLDLEELSRQVNGVVEILSALHPAFSLVYLGATTTMG